MNSQDFTLFEAVLGQNIPESGIDSSTNDDDVVDGFTIDDGNDGNPFDEHFKLIMKNPSEIDEDMLYEIADLINGKYSDNYKNVKRITEMPDTIDQLKNSDLVLCITYDDIPVGVLTITNPMQENYKNIIPGQLYSLYSAYNLDNRVEIEYFVLSDEYDEYPLAQELIGQLEANGIETYMVCSSDDSNTNELLRKSGFAYITSFQMDGDDTDVNLYVRNNIDYDSKHGQEYEQQ